MGKKFTSDDETLMIELYQEQGLTVKEVGRRMHRRPETISKRLRANGIVIRRVVPDGRPPSHSAEEDAKIIELYEQCLSLSQIGTRLHRSSSFLADRLRANGVKIRPRGTSDQNLTLTHKEIYVTTELYKRGLSASEIGKLMKRHDSTIRYRLSQAGVPRRSQHEALKLQWSRGVRKSRKIQIDPRVVRLHKRGYLCKEIAEELGIRRVIVCRMIGEAGLKRSKHETSRMVWQRKNSSTAVLK